MRTVLDIHAYYGHIWQVFEGVGVMGTRVTIKTRPMAVPEPYQAGQPDDICVILPQLRWRPARRVSIGPFVLPSEERRRERLL